MTETLKAALDGWFGTLAFWLVLVWLVSLYLVPQSCEGGRVRHLPVEP